MRALVILAALLLVGCAGHAGPVQVKTVTVKVPVAVSCTPSIPPAPDYATARLTLDESVYDLVKAVLVELLQLRAENAELRAGLEGCK